MIPFSWTSRLRFWAGTNCYLPVFLGLEKALKLPMSIPGKVTDNLRLNGL